MLGDFAPVQWLVISHPVDASLDVTAEQIGVEFSDDESVAVEGGGDMIDFVARIDLDVRGDDFLDTVVPDASLDDGMGIVVNGAEVSEGCGPLRLLVVIRLSEHHSL